MTLNPPTKLGWTAYYYAVHVNLGTGQVCVEGILPSNRGQDARDTLIMPTILRWTAHYRCRSFRGPFVAHPVLAYFRDPGTPEAVVQGRFSAFRQKQGGKPARHARADVLGLSGSVGRNPGKTASCSLAQGMSTPPVGGVALLSIPCYWPKATNLRGLGTGPQEPPKYAKTG